MQTLTRLFLLISLIINLFPSGAYGEIEWEYVSDLLITREFFSAVTMNGKIYVQGGGYYYGNYLSECEVYDPDLDRWTYTANMFERRQSLTAQALNGKIYVFGGSGCGYCASQTSEKYDVTNDLWTYAAMMPLFSRGNASSVTFHDEIYHIAGSTRGGSGFPRGLIARVDIYSPLNNEWIPGIDLPQKRAYHESVVLDNKIYTIGGIGEFPSTVPLSDVFIFNSDSQSWDLGPSLIIPRMHFGCTVLDGKIYVLGGTDGNQSLDSIEVFDPSRGYWMIEESKLPYNLEEFEAVALNGSIYVIGGRDNSGRAINSVIKGKIPNALPIANAGPDKIVLLCDTVTFDGSSSYDPDGDIVFWDWDFGDETSGSGETAKHVYTSAGVYTVNLKVEDNSGAIDEATITVHVLTHSEALEDVMATLQGIIENNLGTPLADKIEDTIAKTDTALEEINKTPPDNQAAAGNIEGAVGDLEAAVKDGLLEATKGTQLMVDLAAIVRELAECAISQAIDAGGDPSKISEAQERLAEGDTLSASEAFKDAVNKYKDALSIAEGELS